MSPGVGYQVWGSVALISLPGRADAGCVRVLRSRSERALATGSRAIAVDLRAMHHIDTQTLSELSVALHTISRHKTKVAVIGADPRVRWVLELCGVERLEFHPTMTRALGDVRERQRPAPRPVWRDILRRQRSARQRSAVSS